MAPLGKLVLPSCDVLSIYALIGLVELAIFFLLDLILYLIHAKFVTASHPGVSLLFTLTRGLIQALFFLLVGWQGVSMFLLGGNSVAASRGAAIINTSEVARRAQPRRVRPRAGEGAGARALPPPAAAAAAGSTAAAADSSAAPPPPTAAALASARAYVAEKRAWILAERLRKDDPSGELLHFQPCTRELPHPWAKVMDMATRNPMLRVVGASPPLIPEPNPQGATVLKRVRSLQLVVAEQLTPELQKGLAFVSAFASVPDVVKLKEVTWQVPDAQWGCVVVELCDTDKVSLGWARHRVSGGYTHLSGWTGLAFGWWLAGHGPPHPFFLFLSPPPLVHLFPHVKTSPSHLSFSPRLPPSPPPSLPRNRACMRH
jgi:hypothetical protein